MGLKMLLAKKSEVVATTHLPSAPVQTGVGGLIGAASAIFGIGGGSFTVPFLSRFGLTMQQAVGTSAACGLPIAIAGALGFMFFGKDVQGLPAEAIGFVHITAFLCISVMWARWMGRLSLPRAPPKASSMKPLSRRQCRARPG